MQKPNQESRSTVFRGEPCIEEVYVLPRNDEQSGVLSTPRLLLAPRSIEDLEDCLVMDRDPLVTRYIPGPWSDPDAHRSFVLGRINRTYPPGLGYWSVREAGSGVFLGWILLIPYEAFAGEVEIGWRFTRSSWGNGFATEAAGSVLNHAFANARLTEVVADIHPMNSSSIRVAQKIGMRHVGQRSVEGQRLMWFRVTSDEHRGAAQPLAQAKLPSSPA